MPTRKPNGWVFCPMSSEGSERGGFGKSGIRRRGDRAAAQMTSSALPMDIDTNRDVARALENLVSSAAILGLEALHGWTAVHSGMAHIERGHVGVVLLGVGDRAA